MKFKTFLLSSMVATTLLTATHTASAASTSSITASESASNSEVKKLYDRYSQPQINNRKEEHGNWHLGTQSPTNDQVRLNIEGTYKIQSKTFNPKRHITLPKGEITLKELDHIVRYANVTYGLYESDNLPQGKIVIHRNDGAFYTLEVQKPLQTDREEVKIKVEDLKNITFDIKE
ncbi:exotoxin beta-grasp domain-containing protein [Staphylococcus delphini]|uniref:exotoxin beta-grasp domain-containing protein n=1 Tax=Staphylococcus delphini TaxID=53344 RepID=UPI000BBBF464|nr:enterotoxin [Staphylococcus delphini]PCF41579.1 enterotoxin [Staphylococcus delphini]